MNKKFNQMCEQALEIQELWKEEPAEGDKVMAIQKIVTGYYDIITSVSSYPGHWMLVTAESRYRGILPKELNENDFYWLPRQNELQIIYKDNRQVEYDGDMFLVFYDWMMSDIKHLDITLDEAWLMFVMEKCFGKKWENESWVDIQ